MNNSKNEDYAIIEQMRKEALEAGVRPQIINFATKLVGKELFSREESRFLLQLVFLSSKESGASLSETIGLALNEVSDSFGYTVAMKEDPCRKRS